MATVGSDEFPHGQDLLASSWLAAGQRPAADAGPSPYPLPDRFRMVAAAGFRGMGINYADLVDGVQRHGHAGIRAMMDDNGIVALEIETLFHWWRPVDDISGWRKGYDDMLEAAARIGISQIKANGDFSDAPPAIAQMSDAFAPLAEQARDAGTVLGLEIIAFSNVADIPAARAIIGSTVGKGGGIALDCWHFARHGIDPSSPATLRAEEITGVEISNVRAVVAGSLFEDTLDNRQLPDEGVYDVSAFLRAVGRTGYSGPIGCEVLSSKMRALPLQEALDRCARSTRALCDGMAAARG